MKAYKNFPLTHGSTHKDLTGVEQHRLSLFLSWAHYMNPVPDWLNSSRLSYNYARFPLPSFRRNGLTIWYF